MSVTKIEIDALYEKLDVIETTKKELAEDFKDAIASFSENHGMEKKSVSKSYKEYKEYVKSRDEYILTDLESDALLVVACPDLVNTP